MRSRFSPAFSLATHGSLLGYLVLERRPIARDYLSALFWPDQEPARGRSSLRRELYNLNQVLPDCWQTDSQTVKFVPTEETTVDIDILEQLAGEQRWQDAAKLLAGEFLEGLYLNDNLVYENWLLVERERWHAWSQEILNNTCEELIRHGNEREALLYARRLLHQTPWDENAQRQIMRLLARTGQREEALRQFAICKQTLADELGIEPSAETAELYQQIAAGDLEHRPALPAFLAETAKILHQTSSYFVLREGEMAWLTKHLDHAITGQGGVAFLTGGPGRGKTALMNAFAQKALEAVPDLLAARGNCAAYAGVGDPYLPFRDIMARLCGDVEARWTAGSISTGQARRLWYGLPLVLQALLKNGPHLLDVFVPGPALLERAMVIGPAAAPWLELLQEQVQRPRGEMAGTEQSALFEQVSSVLLAVAAQRPLLLLIDDMQWMDSASIGLLFHLVRRIAEGRSRILIVCAYRPEEIARDQSGPRHLLAKALSEFRRMFGDAWLSMSWTDEREGRRFVDAVLDCEANCLSEPFRAVLYQRTGGHPLFTIELLRALRERGDLVQDQNGAWQEGSRLDWMMMPTRVEAVIEARIQQLDPEYQRLLSVASVEGDLFTAQVVARVQDLEEVPLLRMLVQDLGKRYRLIQEQEAYQTNKGSVARFGFRHTLFQEYLYQQLGQAERRLLHGAVADALEKVYADELEAICGQLAHHYDKAGNYGRAQHFFILAAENAALIYAFEEATAHYRRALSLAKQVDSSAAELAGLYHKRGLAYERIGQFDPAHADLETALDLSRMACQPRLEWRILIELGKLWASRDYGRARYYFEKALELARKMDDPAALGRTFNRMGNWHGNNENPAKALVYHEEALRIFEELDDRPNLANTLDLLGIVHLLHGDFSTGAAYYNRAIELYRELGDDPRLVSSLIPRALVATGSLFLAAAPPSSIWDPFVDLAEALEVAQLIGSSPDEAWSAWAQSMLFTVQGDFGQALEAGHRGLEIATKIQHREWLAGNRFALGLVYNELLHPEKALPELEAGLALAGELRSQYWVNHMRGALAECYILLNDLVAAEHCLNAVLSEETPMDTAGKRHCWARRAKLALAMDEPALALDIADRLIASDAGLQHGDRLVFLWLVKGEALASMGRPNEARDLLVDGRDYARTRQERLLLWRFHAALGQLDQANGCDSSAAEELAAARLLVEEMANTVLDEALANTFRHRTLLCGKFYPTESSQ